MINKSHNVIQTVCHSKSCTVTLCTTHVSNNTLGWIQGFWCVCSFSLSGVLHFLGVQLVLCF